MVISERERFEISQIFDDILEERDRQNILHPKPCKLFIAKELDVLGMTAACNYMKAENKIREKNNEENWIDTITEEVYEAGAETATDKRIKELIHAASTIIRCIQELKNQPSQN